MLLLLLKTLYELKQASTLWYRHLIKTLIDLKLEQMSEVKCLFINAYILIFFYVNDIAVLYEKKHIQQMKKFQNKFFQIYEMRYIGELQWFLKIRITRDRSQRTLTLCQNNYIDKLIIKFNVNTSFKASGAPMSSYEQIAKNSNQAIAQQVLAYQQRIEFINFAAVIIKSDIAFAAFKLSEFLTNSSLQHMKAINKVLRYLAHTRSYGIVFNVQAINTNCIFFDSSDASFANDVETRYSSQKYCFKLFDGMIDWKTNKQKTITISSTEAELLAISMTANIKMWWDRFFEAIDFQTPPTHIECDNRQTIRAFTASETSFSTKLRHVDIHRHWLRQEVQNGAISIKWTSSTSILTDGLTKMLPPQHHKEFVRLIGLENVLTIKKEAKEADEAKEATKKEAKEAEEAA